MSDPGPTGDGEEAEDAYDRLRRRVLWALPTGLFVVGSRAGDDRNLMTCNWVLQVATIPKLVAVAVEAGSVTRGLIERGGSFSVSLLARSDRALVRRFVKPVRDVETDGRGVAVRLQGEPVTEVGGGLPVLTAAVAWLTCSVRSLTEWDHLVVGGADPSVASHVLVVGEVVGAGATDRLGGASEDDTVLSMADTRMSYGG
jgi:flavin reductase (DIM6/NTAB) family NADH-FMN oxidoreductase RutF